MDLGVRLGDSTWDLEEDMGSLRYDITYPLMIIRTWNIIEKTKSCQNFHFKEIDFDDDVEIGIAQRKGYKERVTINN